MRRIILILVVFLLVHQVRAFSWWPFISTERIIRQGNRHSQSFYAVKEEMLDEVYYDHRYTLYCNAEFTLHKKIKPSKGFKLPDLQNVGFQFYDISKEELLKKAQRMEWEHIVPVQNFGKTFSEWSVGHKNCRLAKNQPYKGRKCAEQESEEFRYMYTDMYNLYPSIGAVNYLRSNFNMTQFDGNVKNTFGSCALKLSRNKAEPPDNVKGLIARTYFYMERTYSRYRIGQPMRGVLQAWDKKYPVSKWECRRAFRIEKVQGNANQRLKDICINKGWYKN